jgi:hypothetical protein
MILLPELDAVLQHYARRSRPTEAAVVALRQAILSHALLPRWHQALDLRQKVTTENPTAVFVS